MKKYALRMTALSPDAVTLNKTVGDWLRNIIDNPGKCKQIITIKDE